MKDYTVKRESLDLYEYLNDPNPKKIKQLAFNLIKYERQINDDARAINDFLDFRNKQLAYTPRNNEKILRDISDYDKYKRISQFINRYYKDASHNTSIINLEFIAWLIDYTPRPLSRFRSETIVNSNELQDSKKEKKSPKPIYKLEIKKEELEKILADLQIPEFEKILGNMAKQQLQLMLQEWKENELMPLFESIIEKRLINLEKKIWRSKRLYRRLGVISLLFIVNEDQLLFEENLFTAIEDYHINFPGNNDIDDSLFESISELMS